MLGFNYQWRPGVRAESRKLVAAVLAVATCPHDDEGERARRLAVLEERMESWFRARGWAPPPRERVGLRTQPGASPDEPLTH